MLLLLFFSFFSFCCFDQQQTAAGIFTNRLVFYAMGSAMETDQTFESYAGRSYKLLTMRIDKILFSPQLMNAVTLLLGPKADVLKTAGGASALDVRRSPIFGFFLQEHGTCCCRSTTVQ